MMYYAYSGQYNTRHRQRNTYQQQAMQDSYQSRYQNDNGISDSLRSHLSQQQARTQQFSVPRNNFHSAFSTMRNMPHDSPFDRQELQREREDTYAYQHGDKSHAFQHYTYQQQANNRPPSNKFKRKQKYRDGKHNFNN